MKKLFKLFYKYYLSPRPEVSPVKQDDFEMYVENFNFEKYRKNIFAFQNKFSVEAVKTISKEVLSGNLNADQICEQTIADNLTTAGLPEPDLMIRTSGEFRISNFLLWQLAYSEIFISNVLWPEFRSKHLIEAVQDYQKRERRFGLVSEQLSSKSKKTNNAKTHSKKAV